MSEIPPSQIILAGETPVEERKVIVLYDHIWSAFNKTNKPFELYTYHDRVEKRKKRVILPGERCIFPKQVQFLRAILKYEAVLYGGAVGAGKSHILRWALIWLLVNWAKAEEYFCSNGEQAIYTLNKEVVVLSEEEAAKLVVQERRLAPIHFGAIEAAQEAIIRTGADRLSNPIIPQRTPDSGLGLRGVEVGLFCETYAALADRQIGKLKSFDPSIGRYVDNESKEFRLHPHLGGGKIKLRNLDDYAKYASSEFAAIAVDELTYNPKAVWDFLKTRRRWPPIEHCPMFGATNPGQIGHQWVYKDFVDPTSRIPPSYDEEEDYHSHGYHFIQALPADNPLLSKQYRVDMKKWPEKLRRALVKGDWSVYAGQFFSMLDPFIHWVTDFRIPDHWTRIRVIDQGGAHPSVCLWMACDEIGNVYVYRELSEAGTVASEFKKKIVQMSRGEVYRLTVGDPSMWSQDYSSTFNKTPAEIYNDRNDGLGSLFMAKANNARVQGWQALSNAFSFEIENGPLYEFKDGIPIINFIRHPKLRIFRSCKYTWDSLTNVQHDDAKVEDVRKTKGTYEPGQGDDEAECVRYGYMAISPSASPPGEPGSDRGNQYGKIITKIKKRGKYSNTPFARF